MRLEGLVAATIQAAVSLHMVCRGGILLTPPRGELERPLREHVGRHAGGDGGENAQ